MAAHVDGEPVPDDTPLTQLGHVKLKRSQSWSRSSFEFRCCPSSDDEGYMSLMEGELSVDQIVPLVARGDRAGGADCVRHALAGSFAKAGFTVVWRPLPKLEGHVAVYSSDEWDDPISEKFDQCFNDYLKGW